MPARLVRRQPPPACNNEEIREMSSLKPYRAGPQVFYAHNPAEARQLQNIQAGLEEGAQEGDVMSIVLARNATQDLGLRRQTYAPLLNRALLDGCARFGPWAQLISQDGPNRPCIVQDYDPRQVAQFL